MNSIFILVVIALLLIILYELTIHPMVRRAREDLAIEAKLMRIKEVDQSMSESVLALMQRAKHPMTVGMVMRRLYPWTDRNYFLFNLVKSNLQALARDGSARCWKSSRGNLVYEVHA